MRGRVARHGERGRRRDRAGRARKGSGSGSAAVDRRTTGDSAALLDPATLERAITVIGTGVVTVVPDEAVGSTSIEAGTTEISVSVQVAWAID